MDRQPLWTATSAGDGSGAVVDEPLYNIGVVARMTGIPVATLRVWERRYGFPAAARTEGGHRIYSGHQVQRLRWVKARVDEGMPPGRAVQALRVLSARGDPLASAVAAPAPDPAEPRPIDHSGFERQLTAALLAHDLDRAHEVIGTALSIAPLEALILSVIRPTLAAIGEGWASGRVSVATEHLATHYLRQRLALWLATTPAARPVAPVVLACAPGEWHDTSLLMFGVLLSRCRWPIAYLGQSVPLHDLAEFVATTQPAAVVWVAMHEGAAEALAGWPRAMPDVAASGRPLVCYGGRVFTVDPTARARMAGLYLGDTLEEGLTTVEDALVSGQGGP